MATPNIKLLPIIIVLLYNKISSTSINLTQNDNPVIYQDDKYNFYEVLYEDKIAEKQFTFEPKNFNFDIYCMKQSNTYKLALSLTYDFPKKKFIMLSSKEKNNRTLVFGDYCFIGFGKISLYNNFIEFNSKKDVCKILSQYQTNNFENIKKFFDECDLEFLKTVKDEINSRGMKLGLFKYPFKDFGPRQLEDLISRDQTNIKKFFNMKVDELKSDENPFPKYVNPGEKEMLKKSSQFLENLKLFCDEREKDESKYS
jgi:hypothetical protein